MSTFKKGIFLVMFLITMSYAVVAQNKYRDCKVYIKEDGLKSISKEEFLKLDSITVEPRNYGVFQHIIIVTGGGRPLQFLSSMGTKINPKVKEWIKERDSCIVSIDEIRFWGEGGTRISAPVVISVK